MSELVPCQGCARHIRNEERSCPFCGIPRDPVATVSAIHPQPVDGRLTRAAVFFAGALAVGGASTACEKQGVDNGASGSPTTTAVVQPYGVPVIREPDTGAPPPATTTDAGSMATPPPATADAGGKIPPNVVQPYGVPVMRDAGPTQKPK